VIDKVDEACVIDKVDERRTSLADGSTLVDTSLADGSTLVDNLLSCRNK